MSLLQEQAGLDFKPGIPNQSPHSMASPLSRSNSELVETREWSSSTRLGRHPFSGCFSSLSQRDSRDDPSSCRWFSQRRARVWMRESFPSPWATSMGKLGENVDREIYIYIYIFILIFKHYYLNRVSDI